MFHSGKVLYKYNMPFVNLTICVMCICDSSLTFMIVSKQFLFHLHSGIFNFTSKNSLYKNVICIDTAYCTARQCCLIRQNLSSAL